jgi:hypothetical protein
MARKPITLISVGRYDFNVSHNITAAAATAAEAAGLDMCLVLSQNSPRCALFIRNAPKTTYLQEMHWVNGHRELYITYKGRW